MIRVRIRIRVSFLSRPIHCKHLSLIESTTSNVTFPNYELKQNTHTHIYIYIYIYNDYILTQE